MGLTMYQVIYEDLTDVTNEEYEFISEWFTFNEETNCFYISDNQFDDMREQLQESEIEEKGYLRIVEFLETMLEKQDSFNVCFD